MNTYNYPDESLWPQLSSRQALDGKKLQKLVSEVFKAILNEGDPALKRYAKQFDHFGGEHLEATPEELKQSVRRISKAQKEALRLAKRNIGRFHRSQKEQIKKIETSAGVVCWRESRPIERVGLYIPGGSAPLFSTVLMLGIPAQIAGCREVVMCTPPDKHGNIHPMVLFAARLAGIKKIFKLGGIQAIAAMALGTETVPKVDKIFGPGNQYVTAAKQYAKGLGIAIDMPAGPSELLVIADHTADPVFVAADLLSQAEHGPDSQVMLVSDNAQLIAETMSEIASQSAQLPRKGIVAESLKNSKAIKLNNIEQCIRFSNVYAPEHLILNVQAPEKLIDKIEHAGSVFLGPYSCESAGDYASGTNHTLPTAGYARSHSGVSLDSFVRKITFQQINAEGIRQIGPSIEIMAEAEQLLAHKRAVSVRLQKLES